MAPSSRFALSLKPNVAYLVLNFCALWKKQTTLPSLAYAGIPYQSLGERAGTLALMIAWSRLPMTRSGSGISPIFARTAFSPSALSARGPRRHACTFTNAILPQVTGAVSFRARVRQPLARRALPTPRVEQRQRPQRRQPRQENKGVPEVVEAPPPRGDRRGGGRVRRAHEPDHGGYEIGKGERPEIGRASCRERV